MSALDTGREPATQPIDEPRKNFSSLQAKLALRGFRLDRLSHERGFTISTGRDFSLDVPSVRDVLAFAERAGIEL